MKENQCEHEWIRIGAEINQQCRWCSMFMKWSEWSLEDMMDRCWELQHE